MPRVVRKYREEYKDEARKRIIAAALDVAKKKGYQAMTIDEIAREVGVTKGTLYLYFENKDDLFNIVLAEGADIFRRTMECSRVETDNLDEALSAIFDQFVGLQTMFGTIDDNLAFIGELIAISARDPGKKEKFFEIFRWNLDTFVREFRILQEKGLIPAETDLEESVPGVVSLIIGAKFRLFFGTGEAEVKAWWIRSAKKLFRVS